MRVSFLEALSQKWRRAVAGNDVVHVVGSTASGQLLSGYLGLGKAAETAAPVHHPATWKQVPSTWPSSCLPMIGQEIQLHWGMCHATM